MVFSGSHEHSLDDKGRLIVPQVFREGLKGDFVVTKGTGRCLFVFPKSYWEEKFENILVDLPMLNPHAIKIQRFFCAEAQKDMNVDSQGRIPISSSLRQFANIRTGAPVMILGLLMRLEIWDKEKWVATRDDLTDGDLSESVDLVGLGGVIPV